MIVRARPNVLQLFFILQGSIVPQILPQIIIIGLLSTIVVLGHQLWPHVLPSFDGGPFALIGIALSVFLSFRNSACYDRWWEARRQWGGLIHSARDLSRQTFLLQDGPRRRLLELACAFAHALVHHLRPEASSPVRVLRHRPVREAARWQAGLLPPDAIARLMGWEIAGLRKTGAIGDIPYQMLDRTISEMSAVQTACERIKGTPVPFAYTLLLHRTAYLFCFCIPFGFANTLGWATPCAAMLVAYTFFGLDALGDELEDPFGTRANSLPLSALAQTLEINLRAALGETDLPPLPTPVGYLLT